MELTIAVGGEDSGREVRSCLNWLQRDSLLRGRVILRSSVPAAGEMGGAADVLTVVLGPEGGVAALAAALSVWLRSRRRDVTVRIASRRASVDIRARTAQDAKELLEQVGKILDDET